MSMFGTESTVETIRDMAKKMRDAADQLDRQANSMEEKQEFEYAGEAINTVASLIPNLRLDLLAARPIRAFQYREALKEKRDGQPSE